MSDESDVDVSEFETARLLVDVPQVQSEVCCYSLLNLSMSSAGFKMAPIPVYTRREKFGIVEKIFGPFRKGKDDANA